MMQIVYTLQKMQFFPRLAFHPQDQLSPPAQLTGQVDMKGVYAYNMYALHVMYRYCNY